MISGPKDSAEDRTLSSICRKYSVEPGRIYRSDGIDTTMRLVRAGKGYAIGPESFGEYYQVTAVPVEPERIISLKFICMQHSLRREGDTAVPQLSVRDMPRTRQGVRAVQQ